MPKINGVKFTPQEIECIKIALDAYELEQEEAADLMSFDGENDAEAMYRKEAQVATIARLKFGEATS